MKASEEIKKMIKEMEGCRLTAYRCPTGHLTIGYGHTGSDVAAGMKVTQQTADALFEKDIARFEDELQRWLYIDGVTALSQQRYDALLSLAFNLGVSKTRGSTLWKKMTRDPDDPTIPAEFGRWVNGRVNGVMKPLPGLVKRRAREAAVWKEGRYS